MQIIKSLLIAVMLTSVLSACELSERGKSAVEKSKGNAQEAVGDATNDSSLKSEGKQNKLKGDLRSAKEDVKDMITGD